MFAFSIHRLTTYFAIAISVACSSSRLQAGWMTIKNDTTNAIVVQEVVEVNGQMKRGKPTNLLPGETLREFLPDPTVKKIEIFESQTPNQVAWSGNLNCKDDSQTFSVSNVGGKVAVVQVPCPPKK